MTTQDNHSLWASQDAWEFLKGSKQTEIPFDYPILLGRLIRSPHTPQAQKKEMRVWIHRESKQLCELCTGIFDSRHDMFTAIFDDTTPKQTNVSEVLSLLWLRDDLASTAHITAEIERHQLATDGPLWDTVDELLHSMRKRLQQIDLSAERELTYWSSILANAESSDSIRQLQTFAEIDSMLWWLDLVHPVLLAARRVNRSKITHIVPVKINTTSAAEYALAAAGKEPGKPLKTWEMEKISVDVFEDADGQLLVCVGGLATQKNMKLSWVTDNGLFESALKAIGPIFEGKVERTILEAVSINLIEVDRDES